MSVRRPFQANEFPAARLRSAFRSWGGFLFFSVLGALLSGCDPGDREVTVTGRRDFVLWDRAYPRNLKDQAPEEWRRVPWTQMRLYNYRFGTKEDGEVWVSVTPRQGADAVLLNVNRWYNQFRLPELVSLEDLKQEPMLGVTGYLVEAEGTYHAGMGADPREETRMLAAAIPYGSSIVTVKMIGSPAEVGAQQETFRAYCRSLEFVDEALISKPAPVESTTPRAGTVPQPKPAPDLMGKWVIKESGGVKSVDDTAVFEFMADGKYAESTALARHDGTWKLAGEDLTTSIRTDPDDADTVDTKYTIKSLEGNRLVLLAVEFDIEMVLERQAVDKPEPAPASTPEPAPDLIGKWIIRETDGVKSDSDKNWYRFLDDGKAVQSTIGVTSAATWKLAGDALTVTTLADPNDPDDFDLPLTYVIKSIENGRMVLAILRPGGREEGVILLERQAVDKPEDE